MDVAEEPETFPDRLQSPASSCVSMKSDASMKNRQEFTKETADRYISSIAGH